MDDVSAPQIINSGWSPEKVASFRAAFINFLKYVKINSKETGGDTILGDHIYEAQRRFLDCVFDGLEQDIHDFKILKSRQLGISTISRALSLFWLGMHPGLQGSMTFDTFAHRDEARNEIKTMMDSLPPRLKFPTIKKYSRDMLILSNDSNLRFLNAGVKKSRASGTLGRSSGLNFSHNSEMCSWENDEGLISYRNALSETFPNRLYLWESTARGFNQWYKMWKEALADDLNQKTCFIGWWAKESQKIERTSPSFIKYGETPPNEEEQIKIDEVLKRYNFKVTQEQLAWYRRKTNPVQSEDTDFSEKVDIEDTVIQEQPWTEEEAFLQSGSTFFPADAINRITKNDLSEKFQSFRFLHGTDFFHCDFIPVTQKRYTHLKVWDEPVDGGMYVVSADPAFGRSDSANNSAIQVLRCYADCLVQVAEYANPNITTQPFAWAIAALAGWYKNVHLIVEINNSGEAVWTELKALKHSVTSGYMKAGASDRGLRNIFSNVRDYMYAKQDTNQASGTQQFKTTHQNKAPLMERLRDLTTDGTLNLRSFDVIEEMKTIVRNGDAIGAEGRNRDDRVFCLAMAIRAWQDHIRRGMSVKGQTKASQDAATRMSIKDQVGMFQKHTLDTFFKQQVHKRRMDNSLSRRAAWRGDTGLITRWRRK